MEDITEHDTETDKLLNDADDQEVESFSSKFTLYPRRWLILAMFSLTSMMNEEIWISLSSITSIVEKYYEVDPIQVNWLSLIYFLLMTLLLAPSSYLLNKHGLKLTLILGGMFNAMGSCLRVTGAGRSGFPFVFGGSFLCALGQCLLFYLPPHIAATWFSEGERDIASAIGMLMTYTGPAIAFLLSTFFVSSVKGDASGIEKGIHSLLITEAAASTFLFLMCTIIAKDKPATPPSRSEELRSYSFKTVDSEEDQREIRVGRKIESKGLNETEEDDLQGKKQDSTSSQKQKAYTTFYIEDTRVYQPPDFKDSLIALLKNKQYCLLCQAYAIYFALAITFTTVLNQTAVFVFPGKEQEIGYMGFAIALSGLVSMLLGGIILSKTKKYKVYTVTVYGFVFIANLIFNIVLNNASSLELAFVFAINYGFFSLAYISAGLEFVAEITYPVPEIISTSVCLMFASMYGMLLTQILGVLLQNGSNSGGYIISGLYAFSFGLVLLVKAPLKRTTVDAGKSGGTGEIVTMTPASQIK